MQAGASQNNLEHALKRSLRHSEAFGPEKLPKQELTLYLFAFGLCPAFLPLLPPPPHTVSGTWERLTDEADG